MKLRKDSPVLQNFEEAIQFEWLETNGLGGWSGSSIIGCNTRRYHGLLVAAIVPPAERMALVSKLDETIITTDGRFELGSNDYGDVIHPTGNKFMTGFSKNLFPEFNYEAGKVKLRKTIAMPQGENSVVVIYDVLEAAENFSLELLPLFSVRGYHSLMHANDSINKQAEFSNSIFKTKAYEGTPDIFIKIPGSNFIADPNWFYHFNYAVEKYRGLDFVEDLFCYGKFNVTLKQGDSLGIVVSTDNPAGKDAHQLLQVEKTRRQLLLSKQLADETIQQLVLAADQFVVKRDEDLKTVIAGYHWFTDWGRDTMISLPGLCLSTGRFDDAKKILAAFAKAVSMGMLPNRFQDNGQAPEYNNVDGTLWYFIAVYKYLQATNDTEFILNEILPVLKSIIDWHFKGTRFNIHVDEDGLLYAGEVGQQLTWMDAKIGDWVVTPRMGKPVEIEALWYNALRIFSALLSLNQQHNDAALVSDSAEKARQSFVQKFWNESGNCLYDVIDENGIPDDSVRPNQLFAVSLPFPLIDGEKAQLILKLVEDQLYTPVGLRSLTPADSHFSADYGGDSVKRDACYHQGTVWSWLLGAYVDALMSQTNFAGSTGKAKAMQVIENFEQHLNEGCLGSVSEIFDAEAPYHPRGCVAQAWGVAEVLRVIKQYGLTVPA